MYITSEIIKKIETLGISPKKSLGQNFLVSQVVISRIIQKLISLEPQRLIEIGPGLGSLTESLLNLNVPLQLIELDHVFSEYWKTRNLDVIEADALKWDWNRLREPDKTILVSNLPYQISSSIVIERSIQRNLLKGMILMFQKEVAERLLAKPKTNSYGMLSVVAQNFWNMEFVTDAGPKDFYPPPRVASRVILFTPRNDFVGESKIFLNHVKAGFSHRRKYLISNLRAIGNAPLLEELKNLFIKLGLSQQIRAEELNIDQWRLLSNNLTLFNHKKDSYE